MKNCKKNVVVFFLFSMSLMLLQGSNKQEMFFPVIHCDEEGTLVKGESFTALITVIDNMTNRTFLKEVKEDLEGCWGKEYAELSGKRMQVFLIKGNNESLEIGSDMSKVPDDLFKKDVYTIKLQEVKKEGERREGQIDFVSKIHFPIKFFNQEGVEDVSLAKKFEVWIAHKQGDKWNKFLKELLGRLKPDDEDNYTLIKGKKFNVSLVGQNKEVISISDSTLRVPERVFDGTYTIHLNELLPTEKTAPDQIALEETNEVRVEDEVLDDEKDYDKGDVSLGESADKRWTRGDFWLEKINIARRGSHKVYVLDIEDCNITSASTTDELAQAIADKFKLDVNAMSFEWYLEKPSNAIVFQHNVPLKQYRSLIDAVYVIGVESQKSDVLDQAIKKLPVNAKKLDKSANGGLVGPALGVAAFAAVAYVGWRIYYRKKQKEQAIQAVVAILKSPGQSEQSKEESIQARLTSYSSAEQKAIVWEAHKRIDMQL